MNTKKLVLVCFISAHTLCSMDQQKQVTDQAVQTDIGMTTHVIAECENGFDWLPTEQCVKLEKKDPSEQKNPVHWAQKGVYTIVTLSDGKQYFFRKTNTNKIFHLSHGL